MKILPWNTFFYFENTFPLFHKTPLRLQKFLGNAVYYSFCYHIKNWNEICFRCNPYKVIKCDCSENCSQFVLNYCLAKFLRVSFSVRNKRLYVFLWDTLIIGTCVFMHVCVCFFCTFMYKGLIEVYNTQENLDLDTQIFNLF